eukprot:TRINITY_DN11504_c0_g1_i1.p1 TRINITY_DN11504_c0_g1~~TRINITY_DN11504_c0_g1_i1.p1  ORF type:complete len:138 (+),score=26.46 TRINITY_DN11504_c0_g1_i1:51-464(+)
MSRIRGKKINENQSFSSDEYEENSLGSDMESDDDFQEPSPKKRTVRKTITKNIKKKQVICIDDSDDDFVSPKNPRKRKQNTNKNTRPTKKPTRKKDKEGSAVIHIDATSNGDESSNKKLNASRFDNKNTIPKKKGRI